MGERTLYMDDGVQAFVVNDGTGTAYVDPENAELVLTSGDEVTVDAGDEPPASVREFLDRETDVDPVSRRRRRYTEVRIGVGDPVLVAGQATPESAAGLDGQADPGPAEGPGGRTTTTITEAGDAQRFYVTDDTDKGLGRRLVEEALTSFLVASLLLAFAYYLLFV